MVAKYGEMSKSLGASCVSCVLDAGETHINRLHVASKP